MTLERQWQLVQLVEPAIPVGVTLLVLLALPWPHRFRWRACVAITLAWIASVIFKTEVLNSIGIARAEQAGAENPWVGFDNNNNLGVLVLGWLIPTITILLFLLSRWARRRCSTG
jgi:hypothetical protein